MAGADATPSEKIQLDHATWPRRLLQDARLAIVGHGMLYASQVRLSCSQADLLL